MFNLSISSGFPIDFQKNDFRTVIDIHKVVLNTLDDDEAIFKAIALILFDDA